MDPITLGAHALYEQLRVLLSEAPPGQAAHAVARVSVRGTQVTDLSKAMRAYENMDWNTHPFLLLGFDVVDERDFLARAKAQLRADERSIRECLSRAGVAVDPVELPAGPLTLASMVAFLARLSEVLAPQLEGIVVGLVPPRVEDVALWGRIVEAVARTAKHPKLVVLVLDDSSDFVRRVAPHALRFEVDEKALWKFLREGKGRAQAGPPREDAPKLTPEQRRAVEKEMGRRIPSEDTGRVLKHLLLDAGEAYAAGKLELAAKKFRVARTYCQMLGLETERAMCAVSVGTSKFLLGDKVGALRAFEEGRELGRRAGVKSVVAQAELGIAATHLSLKSYERAREAYATCAVAAEGNAAMEIECLRMRGQTFLAEGRPGDAAVTWLDALERVEKLPPGARGGTAYRMVASHLAEALPLVGRAHEVPGVRARERAIDDGVHEAMSAALEAASVGEGAEA